MATHTVEPGQRYRDLQPGSYGREWLVEAVQADAMGIRHARLVKVSDLTDRKTLSAAVLADTARFEECLAERRSFTAAPSGATHSLRASGA
jgi:hypothetical protein